jgi:hypothetical protein
MPKMSRLEHLSEVEDNPEPILTVIEGEKM